MFEPGTVTIQNCLFFRDIPQELRSWCKRQGVQGRLFERFDGGGFTGLLIEFEDVATKNRVAEEFTSSDRDHLLCEAIRPLGSL